MTRTAFAVALFLLPAAALAQRPVSVNVDSTPQGAQVFVDSPSATSIGVTPLKGTRIVPGPHTLHFTLAGHEPAQLPIEVRRRNDSFRMNLVALGRIDLSGSGDAEGASVRIDGEVVGTIPVSRALKQGRHEVRVSKEGFQEWSQWFEVRPGETRAQTVVLERQRAQAGSLLVAGDVPGALVLVDGQERGRSPVVVDALEAGAHAVEIRAEGLPVWSQTVTVEAGNRLTVNPSIQPDRPASGSLRIISNVDGAQVVLDGDPIGVVPADAPEVAPGSHIVEVMAPGHRPGRRDVTVEAGRREVVRIELEALPQEAPRASLRVVSPVPNAQVFLDGQLAGNAPLAKDDLSVGTHYVTVQAPGYRDWVRNVTLEAGASVELAAELVPVSVLKVTSNVDGANVFLDGNAIGRTPFETSSAPAGDHEIEVRMRGYHTFHADVTLTPGQPREMAVTLQEAHEGPTDEEREARRRAIMPWAAAALPVGDVAFDLSSGWPYLLEFRFGVGILEVVDAGVGIHTYFETTEFEGHARLMFHPFQALGFGVQGMVGGGLGPDDRNAFLLGGSGLATLFFADKGAFTLQLDLESSTERLVREPKGAEADTLCADGTSDRELVRHGCETDENVRGILGGTMEIVMGRSWNFFGQFRGALIGGDRYAYEKILFFDNSRDGGLYFRLGLTYKF